MTTTYPWNGTRATREVIIENHEPGVKRRDLELLGKSMSCQLKGLKVMQKDMFKKTMQMKRCSDRKVLRKLNEVQLLEIIRQRRRGGGGGDRDRELLEIILLGGAGGLGGSGDDDSNLLIPTLLLEEEGRRGGNGGGRHNRDELEMMIMNNRINKLSNNVTQLDTLLGVRPINPASAQV